MLRIPQLRQPATVQAAYAAIVTAQTRLIATLNAEIEQLGQVVWQEGPTGGCESAPTCRCDTMLHVASELADRRADVVVGTLAGQARLGSDAAAELVDDRGTEIDDRKPSCRPWIAVLTQNARSVFRVFHPPWATAAAPWYGGRIPVRPMIRATVW